MQSSLLLRKRGITNLIMVPGHGIFQDNKWMVANWLEPFVPFIEKQIESALSMSASSSSSLVMFSGGQTNAMAGRISEAQSYKNAALALGFAKSRDVAMEVEEFALDSYQNLLFSICRFKQVTGRYPVKVTVVGFEFKRNRFVNEHRRAIRFSNFEYVGIGQGDTNEQAEMERTGAVLDFQRDPYGCAPPLSTKRMDRNPFHQTHSYQEQCPELIGLFQACGPDIYSGDLPWS